MYKTKLRLWKILFPAWLYFIEENDDVNEKKKTRLQRWTEPNGARALNAPGTDNLIGGKRPEGTVTR